MLVIPRLKRSVIFSGLPKLKSLVNGVVDIIDNLLKRLLCELETEAQPTLHLGYEILSMLSKL